MLLYEPTSQNDDVLSNLSSGLRSELRPHVRIPSAEIYVNKIYTSFLPALEIIFYHHSTLLHPVAHCTLMKNWVDTMNNTSPKICTIPTLLSSLIRKCCDFDEIFITGCIVSCQNDNFQCNQWRIFHQNFHVCVLGQFYSRPLVHWFSQIVPVAIKNMGKWLTWPLRTDNIII